MKYPRHRKSPVRHKVRAHLRKGKPVRSFMRGSRPLANVKKIKKIEKQKNIVDAASFDWREVYEANKYIQKQINKGYKVYLADLGTDTYNLLAAHHKPTQKELNDAGLGVNVDELKRVFEVD